MSRKQTKPTKYSRRNNSSWKLLQTPELPSTLRNVILLLIANLNAASNCQVAWPSVATLAKKLGVTKRTVQRHLKVVRKLGIFSVTRLPPKEAVIYVQAKYGDKVKINLKDCRRQAPTIYETNEHELWYDRKPLSSSVRKAFQRIILEAKSNDTNVTTSNFSKPSKVMTRMSSSSNDTDVIQTKKKENASDEPLPSSFAFATPLGLTSQKGVTAGHPDRVNAIINHIPTHPPFFEKFSTENLETEGVRDCSGKYQATSGLKGASSQANCSPTKDQVFEPGEVDLAQKNPRKDKEDISVALTCPSGYSGPIGRQSSKEAKGEPREPLGFELPPTILFEEPEEQFQFCFEPEEKEYPIILWEEPEERDLDSPENTSQAKESQATEEMERLLSEQLTLTSFQKRILHGIEREFDFPKFPLLPPKLNPILSARFRRWLNQVERGITPKDLYLSQMRNPDEPQTRELVIERLFAKPIAVEQSSNRNVNPRIRIVAGSHRSPLLAKHATFRTHEMSQSR